MTIAIYTDQSNYLLRIHYDEAMFSSGKRSGNLISNVMCWKVAPNLYKSEDDDFNKVMKLVIDEEPGTEIRDGQLYIDDETMLMLKIKYGTNAI